MTTRKAKTETTQSGLFEAEVTWDVPQIREWRGDAGERFLECPECHVAVARTIVPHIRKNHPDVWASYVAIFRQMHAAGRSYKQIMWAFQRRFTWVVIARELTDSDGRAPSDDLAGITIDPPAFKLETTTRWSFPRRGSWGLHDSTYRGNWAPEVPRNLIERYCPQEGVVLDPFLGGGTTILEAMSLNRRSTGIDVSPKAVRLSSRRTEILADALRLAGRPVPEFVIERADARALPIADDSVDLICAHPPYLDIIRYTTSQSGDLSAYTDPAKFAYELGRVFSEMYRVLKRGGFAAVLIGDVRREGELIPLGFLTLRALVDAFDLKEVVIKDQHKSAMSQFWSKKNGATHLTLMHEYLFVVTKGTVPTRSKSYLAAL